MRRRPSTPMTAYRSDHDCGAGRRWLRSQGVWHHPGAARGPQLTVVAPQGSLAPCPKPRPMSPAATFDGLDARARQATADAAKSGADISTVVLDRNTGQIVSNGNRTDHPDRVGGEAVHRRRPAAAGVQGPDTALSRRPQVTRRHAAVLRRQRGRELLEPQRRQRCHHPRRRAVRVDGHDDALQRELGTSR